MRVLFAKVNISIFLVLFSAFYFSSEVNAADGSLCGAYLTERSAEEVSPERQLQAYLADLLKNEQISTDELQRLRKNLLQNRLESPIQDPELSIDRMIAHEKIEDLLSAIGDATALMDWIHSTLLMIDRIDSVRDSVVGDVAFRYRFVMADTAAEIRNAFEVSFSEPNPNVTLEFLKWVVELFESKGRTQLELAIRTIFSYDFLERQPDFLKWLVERTKPEDMGLLAEEVFSQKSTKGFGDLLEVAIDRAAPNTIQRFAVCVFSREWWGIRLDLFVKALLKAPKDAISAFIMRFEDVLSGYWTQQPGLLRLLIEHGNRLGDSSVHHALAYSVFSFPAYKMYPDLFRLALERASPEHLRYYVTGPLTFGHWSAFPEFLRLAIERLSPEYSSTFFTPFINEGRFPFGGEDWPNRDVLFEALGIQDHEARARFLREKYGRYSWEGTEQENLEEYLNTKYGLIE